MTMISCCLNSFITYESLASFAINSHAPKEPSSAAVL